MYDIRKPIDILQSNHFFNRINYSGFIISIVICTQICDLNLSPVNVVKKGAQPRTNCKRNETTCNSFIDTLLITYQKFTTVLVGEVGQIGGVT